MVVFDKSHIRQVIQTGKLTMMTVMVGSKEHMLHLNSVAGWISHKEKGSIAVVVVYEVDAGKLNEVPFFHRRGACVSLKDPSHTGIFIEIATTNGQVSQSQTS